MLMPRTRSVSRVTEQGRGDERGPLKKQRWSTVTVTVRGLALFKTALGTRARHISHSPGPSERYLLRVEQRVNPA